MSLFDRKQQKGNCLTGTLYRINETIATSIFSLKLRISFSVLGTGVTEEVVPIFTLPLATEVCPAKLHEWYGGGGGEARRLPLRILLGRWSSHQWKEVDMLVVSLCRLRILVSPKVSAIVLVIKA